MYLLKNNKLQAHSGYLATMLAMIRKDFFLLKQKTIDLIINSSLILSMEMLNLCYLYPLFGMPKSFILPTFIGWPLLNIIINLGYCFSMKYTIGAIYTGYGFMEFDLTLPLPTGYLLTYYITSFIIEAACATLPLIIIGFKILSYADITFDGSLLLFCVIYIISLGLIGTIFLALSFFYENHWFKNNLWPRRIGPLMAFGAVATPWFDTYSYSNVLGTLMLLNPLTYILEAMRNSLLSNGNYISIPLCIIIIIISYICTGYWLIHSLRKKLDLI